MRRACGLIARLRPSLEPAAPHDRTVATLEPMRGASLALRPLRLPRREVGHRVMNASIGISDTFLMAKRPHPCCRNRHETALSEPTHRLHSRRQEKLTSGAGGPGAVREDPPR